VYNVLRDAFAASKAGEYEMTFQSVTLQLPEPIYRYLQQIAAATQRPLEQLAEQSIVGNLPPSIASMPAEMQRELLSLQTAPIKQLRQAALGQMSPTQQARHLALLDKNSRGAILPAEQEELAALRLAADRLMLQKAYAWAVLRWRGQPVPELDDLPTEPA
jgi:predicted transcriptional regulator